MSAKQVITSVIYDRKGRVLSVGQNSYVKTHPMMARHAHKVGQPDRIFVHAEVASIVRCADLSKAHRIAVFRYGKSGQPLLAKPCAVCQSAIEAAGIKVIDYTISE